MVELQYNFPIKSVQTDGGGEFRPFTQFLNPLGIIHRLTCPHTHHQNGSVERKHRHIVETGLTLLTQANLPLKFWDHAFLTATYLINRPYSTQKMNFISKECIFLGYSPTHKGYKCLDSTGKIFLSKDVVFNESRFPYSELFPSGQSISVQPNGPALSTFFPTSVPFSTIPPPSQPSLSPNMSTSPPPPSPNTLSTPTPSPTASLHVPSPIHISPPSPVNPSNPGDTSLTNGPVLNPTPITIVPPSPPPSQSLSPQSSSDISSNSPPIIPHRIHPQNTHSMSTRGKNGIVQHRLHPTLLLTHVEPTSYKQALNVPEWLEAMRAEYDALLTNKTWSLFPLPNNRQAIGCKWVFRLKQNPDGTLNKYKARLVAKGFHQKPGFDYNETFSPVVKPVTVRTVLSLAVTNHWPIQQLDINNAFLNGLLDEEVYMVQPPGFEAADKSLVCKLHKALYGLKQAPRAWFERLRSALVKLGFSPSKCDPSLFTLHANHHSTFLLVYVDDIIITGSSKDLIHQLIRKLDSEFSLKDLGKLDYFLGIEVHHSTSGSLLLSQTKYIRDLLNKANMGNANSMASPMASSTKLS
ncbi:retrovirus-related Pol polyprotein from transposon TNT 1-94, partial [Trifolium medium]|nr:retrovirus-related Pol polyprotein from transposon TNT 1-94 [Trifolium medium]